MPSFGARRQLLCRHFGRRQKSELLHHADVVAVRVMLDDFPAKYINNKEGKLKSLGKAVFFLKIF